MSGAITPPAAIDPANVARQTNVYGDRPFVDPRTGFLTNDAYQLLSRLSAGFGATVENVGTVVTATNVLSSNITEVNNELTVINEAIENNTTVINSLLGDPNMPPTPVAPNPVSLIEEASIPLYPPAPPRERAPDALPLWPDPPAAFPLARAVGLGFFFGAGW